jgi:short-subunit dehydrogenase
MDLDGKVVWITGASSGIGEALARRMAAKGARLVLSARREERLAAVREACARPEDHFVMPLDLTDPEGLEYAAERVLEHFGHVDVMIHNGGVSQRGLARETELAVDRKLMETDYFGAVALTKALLPGMRERGAGRFVVVSSLVGKFGTPLRSGYSAAKHALHGFFESLAAEEHDAGVGVTMVCPGFIRTELSYRALTGDGSPQGTLDRAQAAGMSADECARRMVRAVEGEKREMLIGGRERWAVLLKRLAPGLFARVIRRARVT